MHDGRAVECCWEEDLRPPHVFLPDEEEPEMSQNNDTVTCVMYHIFQQICADLLSTDKMLLFNTCNTVCDQEMVEMFNN